MVARTFRRVAGLVAAPGAFAPIAVLDVSHMQVCASPASPIAHLAAERTKARSDAADRARQRRRHDRRPPRRTRPADPPHRYRHTRDRQSGNGGPALRIRGSAWMKAHLPVWHARQSRPRQGPGRRLRPSARHASLRPRRRVRQHQLAAFGYARQLTIRCGRTGELAHWWRTGSTRRWPLGRRA